VDGNGPPEVLVDGATDPYSPSLTPDGKFVVMSALSGVPSNGGDVAFAPVDRSAQLRFVAEVPGHDYTASVSPDNRWVLYANAFSGRVEVYVRPFPGPGVPVQVSKDGGAEPVWSRDGHTIFFRRLRTVMAARISLGSTATVSGISELFTGDYLIDPGYGNFDAAPGGRRFVQLQNVDRQEETILIYNWAAELRKSWH
jgi:Tol biopolymer transport system component